MFSQLNYVSIKFAITVPTVPSFKVMYDSLHTAQQSYMYRVAQKKVLLFDSVSLKK